MFIIRWFVVFNFVDKLEVLGFFIFYLVVGFCFGVGDGLF